MPLWADAFGQIDAGVSYKFDDRLTVSLEGQNLNNAMYKQMMQQTVGMMGRSWYASGPRYTLRASYSF
jgi:iron complex outermembrane receptor protein